MDSNDIKELIIGLLKHMNVGVDSIETKHSDGRECFSVKTPDSHMLIGTKGANLFALNHIVKKIVSSKNAAKKATAGSSAETVSQSAGEKEMSFFIDVNGYQETAAENIKNLAKVMGDRARSFKTSVELEPMSSYDRMVIHSYLQESTDLKTESIGEGERRRVVIKYIGDSV
ncbi:MAG TPA: hypothetical protein DEF00_03075 [Candidatus Taylorbacteria bacterium]|nr:MAG: Jag protein [Parcubacteria group bacterium GW2011_GWA2_47_64]KKU96813.1 MAG: Jag protein [Parcubacteria group bacterium GW2011_GWC2_48_17]HBV01348.1 hypothetical protein [Candidatus Taylorbacteria bacterium]